jgi:hypothetical protein
MSHDHHGVSSSPCIFIALRRVPLLHIYLHHDRHVIDELIAKHFLPRSKIAKSTPMAPLRIPHTLNMERANIRVRRRHLSRCNFPWNVVLRIVLRFVPVCSCSRAWVMDRQPGRPPKQAPCCSTEYRVATVVCRWIVSNSGLHAWR